MPLSRRFSQFFLSAGGGSVVSGREAQADNVATTPPSSRASTASRLRQSITNSLSRQSQKDGQLLKAVRNGAEPSIIKKSLENGANPNVGGENWNTALHIAVITGHVKAVRVLVKHDGIKLDTVNLAGKTAKDLADSGNKLEIFTLIDEASPSSSSSQRSRGPSARLVNHPLARLQRQLQLDHPPSAPLINDSPGHEPQIAEDLQLSPTHRLSALFMNNLPVGVENLPRYPANLPSAPFDSQDNEPQTADSSQSPPTHRLSTPSINDLPIGAHIDESPPPPYSLLDRSIFPLIHLPSAPSI